MLNRRLLAWLLAFVALGGSPVQAEDGYELWLRYVPVADGPLLASYRQAITHVALEGDSPTLTAARHELERGLRGLLAADIPFVDRPTGAGALVVGTPAGSATVRALGLTADLEPLGPEGYLLRAATVEGRPAIVVAANTDIGALYGVFHLLRLIQTHQTLDGLSLASAPRIGLRLLNHWDNLDRTVERGYAGFSLWDWHKLPDYTSPRCTDYARANASIGINGTVLTNVNANATVLTERYLRKAAALAGVFRPYGLRVYLTARFSAPIEIGGLGTADPLDPGVRAWWRAKADEIYRLIPDFGGFLVKANSEGQPGPQDYARSHADGANMLAEALAPHGGVVMWRAFVYSHEVPDDRARQAYDEFRPLDGAFADNVLVQVKNGPIDFQPREPFHPLFGAMPSTPLMMEFQITQEYLGQGTHSVYLAPMWKEVLEADTHARGPGSTVARVVDGSLDAHALTGVAGVANTGTDRNWTGGHLHQANWHAFGRLAWDHELSPADIADEWLRMTFTNDPAFVRPVQDMMLASHQACVDYMTPLGLHHLMAVGHHYGPGPWVDAQDAGRPDWSSVYYHRADAHGLGFDRTPAGSDAVGQYHPPVRDRFASRETTPEDLLLWFHRVRWDDRLPSGRTLWEELVHRYSRGVEAVRGMQRTWAAMEGKVDAERHRDVRLFLDIQEREARWWRDASLLYWQSFHGLPIPDGFEPPEGTLDSYRNRRDLYVPGLGV